MLIIWALSALIVGITYFITYQEKVNLEKEIGKLTREVDDLNNQLAETQALVSEFSPDGALLERSNNLRILLETKKELKNFLKDHDTLKNTGYASFMDAMAHIQNSRVSISKFQLEGIDASINGFAYKGYDVPAWVKEFKNYAALSPIVFGGVTMNYEEDLNLVAFELPKRTQEEKKNKKSVQVEASKDKGK